MSTTTEIVMVIGASVAWGLVIVWLASMYERRR
jgi:hypothetical protein